MASVSVVVFKLVTDATAASAISKDSCVANATERGPASLLKADEKSSDKRLASVKVTTTSMYDTLKILPPTFCIKVI